MQESDSNESTELYFLIANFLTNASPCSRAAAVLRQELVRRLALFFQASCIYPHPFSKIKVHFPYLSLLL